MTEESGTPIPVFIQQIRGTTGEFASLVYLAAALRQPGEGAKLAQALSEEQLQTINVLKTRIAELSRYSEKKMRKAAITLMQLGKALEEQGTAENVGKQFEPIRLMLQKQIDDSRRTVQVGMEAVNGLNGLIDMQEAAKPTGVKKATKAGRPGARKKSESAVTRKRAIKKSKGATAAPRAGKGATGE